MSHGDTIYIVAPRADRPIDDDWASAVARVGGLRVIGAFGPTMQVAATDAAAAELRRLFGGALRVEVVKRRDP